MRFAMHPVLTRDNTHLSFYPRARREDEYVWHERDEVVPEEVRALQTALTVAAPEILRLAEESMK